jgi:hypothetical protein
MTLQFKERLLHQMKAGDADDHGQAHHRDKIRPSCRENAPPDNSASSGMDVLESAVKGRRWL